MSGLVEEKDEEKDGENNMEKNGTGGGEEGREESKNESQGDEEFFAKRIIEDSGEFGFFVGSFCEEIFNGIFNGVFLVGFFKERSNKKIGKKNGKNIADFQKLIRNSGEIGGAGEHFGFGAIEIYEGGESGGGAVVGIGGADGFQIFQKEKNGCDGDQEGEKQKKWFWFFEKTMAFISNMVLVRFILLLVNFIMSMVYFVEKFSGEKFAEKERKKAGGEDGNENKRKMIDIVPVETADNGESE